MDLPIRLRSYKNEDEELVYHSWLNEYKRSHFGKTILSHIFFRNHRRIINGLLERNKPTIACNKEEENQIYGFLSGEINKTLGTVIHWIYVKGSFRGFNISELLIQDFLKDNKQKQIYCTHKTSQGMKVITKYNMIYNPYLWFTWGD